MKRFLHVATRERCSCLGKGRSVLVKFLLRFHQEAGSKQAHLAAEQSRAYLLHCSRSTRTASAAPFPGPAAGSWCARPGLGRHCTSERSQPSRPACSTKQQLHEKEVLEKESRNPLQQQVNMPTCPTALPITDWFCALPPFPHTKPLNSSSSINSIIQVQQFAGLKAGSSKSNTDKDLTQEILHYTICQQSNQRTQKYKQTYPLHALQRTFLLSCSLVVFPLYRSSKETLQNKVFLLGYHLTIISPWN